MSDKLSINHVRFQNMVLIKAWPNTKKSADEILASYLKVKTLPNVGEFIIQEDTYCAELSPGHFMLFSNDKLLCSDVTKLFTADIASVVDISHSRCGLRLSGEKSTDLLNKGIAINLNDNAFPTMSVLQSSIHSIGVILFKLKSNDYLVFSYSSFFENFDAWVIDSAAEYGYAQP